MEIDITESDVCMLIALCKACGKISGKGLEFARIEDKLNKAIGI